MSKSDLQNIIGIIDNAMQREEGIKTSELEAWIDLKDHLSKPSPTVVDHYNGLIETCKQNDCTTCKINDVCSSIDSRFVSPKFWNPLPTEIERV